MSNFNFGEVANLGVIGGNTGLIVNEGESALFEPGEIPLHSSFADAPPEEESVIEEVKTPTKKTAKEKQSPTIPEPVESALLSDLEEDEIPKPGVPKDKEPKAIPEPLNSEEETEQEDPNYNPYKEYADDMFKAGILTPLDGDDELEFNSEEDVKNRFLLEKQAGAQKMLQGFLGKFGDEHVKAFNAIFVQGNSPEVYYQKATRIENLEKANLEDTGTQEKLVKAFLSNQGWSQEDIDEKLEAVKSYDGLEKEAKVAHKYLLKAEQDQLAADATKNQQRIAYETQQAQIYTKTVGDALTAAIQKKEFAGIPVSNKTAAKVYDMMVNKQWELNGKTMTTIERIAEDIKDPRNVELALKIALMTENGWNFDSIKKKAVTEETNTLFNSIKRKQTSSKKISTGNEKADDNWYS